MPKRVAPLSAKALAAVRPGANLIELADGYVSGLRVRIQPSGTVTWSLNIRDRKGVRRRFDVGAATPATTRLAALASRMLRTFVMGASPVEISDYKFEA